MKFFAFIAALVSFCAAIGDARGAEADGQQAFKARCSKCHGDSGTGTFMLAKKRGKETAALESRTDLAPDLIRHVVRNGIVSMPAITRVEVTDDELRAIIEYLTRPRK